MYTIESRLEIVGTSGVSTFNVYRELEQFPQNHIFRKRLVAIFYDRAAAEEYVNTQNNQTNEHTK